MESSIVLRTENKGYTNCERCQLGGYHDTIRVSVKNQPDSRSHLFHVHHEENFQSFLLRLCDEYPDTWRKGEVYYFYIDLGGRYHYIEEEKWLRDKDVVLVTTVDEIEDLPKISLRAVHAALRDDVELQPHQIDGVNTMIQMEKAYRGGILADEMGLGKTIQTLTVVLRQQPLTSIRATTLVIVPSRALGDQWADEIRSKTTYGSLPYFVYNDTSIALIDQPCFRVVITTYDRVRGEFKKRQLGLELESPLFDIDWHRIVLDESHKVRARTMLAQAVTSLKGKYKWCLSGTPFQNDITELHPIFEFLGIEVDPRRKYEEEYVTDLLKDHMIRRTKSVLQNKITMLPKKENRITLEFSAPERALYDYLERLLYHQISMLKIKGDRNHQIVSAAILYLRLKQVCGHHMILIDKFPDLIPMARSGNDPALADEIASGEVSRERNYWDEASEYEQALEIIESYYDQFGNLQEPIDLSQLQKLKFIKHSTKVTWLVGFLRQILGSNTHEKIVVVSQFVDVIIKITEMFTQVRIPFESYHGNMSVYARKIALHKFNHDPRTRVLIMSLKAGGVGLNLQRANHMVILDRWWNPATMDQAVARIHRMNQLKETFIHTVVIKDTIEESLMDTILDKKNALFQKIIEDKFSEKKVLSLEVGSSDLPNEINDDVTEVFEEPDDLLMTTTSLKGRKRAGPEDEFLQALDARTPGMLDSIPKSLVKAMKKADTHERIENVSRKLAAINKKKRVRI